MIKILFTSVGRRVELIQAFKDASIDLKIPVKLMNLKSEKFLY